MILRKRLIALEVVTTGDNLVTRASLDSMDAKFEEALKEVAESIDQYVGVVNDTSSK